MKERTISEWLQVRRNVDSPLSAPLLRRMRPLAYPFDVPTWWSEVVLLLAPDRKTLAKALPKVLKEMMPDASLWLAYPKLTSKLADDLSRDVILELTPDYGLETVGQIAIDADWSALRLQRMIGSG